jgi:hypothetical protein
MASMQWALLADLIHEINSDNGRLKNSTVEFSGNQESIAYMLMVLGRRVELAESLKDAMKPKT